MLLAQRALLSTSLLAILTSLGCAAPPAGGESDADGTFQDLSARRNEAYCAAIKHVTLSVGSLESNVLSLTIENGGNAASQLALSAYPAIRVTFDPPVVKLPTSPGDGIETLTGSLEPGVSRSFGIRIKPNEDVSPGTVVTVHAAAADNVTPFDHCSGDGPEATGTITLGGT
jgi:hypothetical protein